MKKLFLVFVLLSACFVETPPPPEPVPYPGPYIYDPWDGTTYCGDGYCDVYAGEDGWWCVDCGYDWYLDGPSDGGFCGDGHCFGYETARTCWKDCKPIP